MDASVSVDWHTPPRARKPQRRVRLRGELARGDLMTNVFALYDPPAPPGMTDNPDRRAAGRAVVVEADDPAVPTEVLIVERVGSDGNTFDQLPFALTPGPPVPTTALRESIESTAAAVAAGFAAAAPHRRGRHPAAPRAPHPQRRSAAPQHRHRRRHHRRGAGPGLVVPGGARAAGNRQDAHRRPGDQPTGHRTRLAHRCRRAIARHGGEPVGLCDRRRTGSGAGRQETLRPHCPALAGDRRQRVRRHSSPTRRDA